MNKARIALMMAALAASQAHAGLFDDEEARKQIGALRGAVEARFDTQSKSMVDLAGQIQALRDENARLRGQVETLTYELDLAKKRQQDYYVDLDTRLRKFETPAGPATAAAGGNPDAPAKAPGDPAAEALEYDAAINLMKANKFKDAAAAFSAFVNKYPDSTLAPNAQYWQGNAYHAQGDCKRAIDAQLVVATRWQDSAKAPDAMLAIAGCQQEQGNFAASQRTLETLVGKYPDSQAATQARSRLKKK